MAIDTPKPTQLEKLDTTMETFESFLKGDGSTTPSLRDNWIYLQIFATYGLWLPSTNADMLTTLNLTAAQAATYTWFNSMVQAYRNIYESSNYFFKEIFNKMLDLGNGLKNYASNVAGQESEFTLISKLVQTGSDQDLPMALALLKDLKASAASNATLAGTIKDNMTTYRVQLVTAHGSMRTVKTQVDLDERTSQATIDTLAGDKDHSGSVAQLQAQYEKDRKEYNHDVVVASTAVTYAWVLIPPPFPGGLIAAAVVAGVFGKRATDMLDTMSKLAATIRNANTELQTAVAVHRTDDLAEGSLTSLLTHLNTAIDKVTLVQNAWLGVQGGLDLISDAINNTLMPDGTDGDKLKASQLIILKMKQAQVSWTNIQPTINELMDNPVINVESEAVNVDEFVKKVQDEEKKAA